MRAASRRLSGHSENRGKREDGTLPHRETRSQEVRVLTCQRAVSTLRRFVDRQKEFLHEADVPAEQAPPEEDTRLPGANEDHRVVGRSSSAGARRDASVSPSSDAVVSRAVGATQASPGRPSQAPHRDPGGLPAGPARGSERLCSLWVPRRGPARAGFAVSRQIRGAVRRNRARRRLRAAYRGLGARTAARRGRGLRSARLGRSRRRSMSIARPRWRTRMRCASRRRGRMRLGARNRRAVSCGATSSLLRPLLPAACRFQPQLFRICASRDGRSWSHSGRLVGAAGVSARCHPFHPGGYDPPPRRSDAPEREASGLMEKRAIIAALLMAGLLIAVPDVFMQPAEISTAAQGWRRPDQSQRQLLLRPPAPSPAAAGPLAAPSVPDRTATVGLSLSRRDQQPRWGDHDLGRSFPRGPPDGAGRDTWSLRDPRRGRRQERAARPVSAFNRVAEPWGADARGRTAPGR